MLVLPKEEISDTTQYGDQLAKAMAQQRFNGSVWHGGEKKMSGYESPHLRTAKYVLVRNDNVQPSLRPRYSGPYEVISRGKKTFVLKFADKMDTVTIDRLIPFHSDE